MSIFHSNLAAGLPQTLNSVGTVFKNGFRELMSMSTDEESITAPVNRFREVILQMNRLLGEIRNLQGTDPGREPELTPALNDRITDYFQEVKRQLQDLRTARDSAGNAGYSPYPAVNQALDIFLSASPETWLDRDIQDLSAQKKAAASEEQIRDFLNEVTGSVSPEREPETRQEYLPEKRMIPNAMLCSGDPKDLASFYLANQGKLRNEEKEYLKHRLRSLRYVELLAEKSSHQNKKLTKITESGQGKDWELSMPDLQLYEHQNSGNGCWSCSYQLLLQSRGVLLDQKLVRAFRPKLNSSQTMKLPRESVNAMLGDNIGSPFEMADLTMKLLPNTAMFNTTLTIPTHNTAPGTPDREEMARKFDQVVEKALKEHRSPVSISNSAHFRTIVGRSSDGKWQIRDSVDSDPTKMNYYSTEELLDWSADIAKYRQNFVASLQLTWLKDLEPQKDGTCRDLAADGFKRVNFTGFTSQPGTGILHTEGEADSDSELSTESHIFLNRSGNPEHLQITESLSVPAALNPEVRLVPQDNFVKGPEFYKWNHGRIPKPAEKPAPQKIEGWEEFSLFDKEEPQRAPSQEKEPELLPKDLPDLAPLSYMSKTQFGRKLTEDKEFRGTVEVLKGRSVPAWKALGKRPGPFSEPAPIEPPDHSPLARFGNWLRKIFTGVDRYAEEMNRYRQSLSDWHNRMEQRDLEQQDYDSAERGNAIFEDAYRLMSESHREAQKAELPAFRKVRAEFRQRTETKLRNALKDPEPKTIAAACADILADRYLSSAPDARTGGPDTYRSRLDKLAGELTVTVGALFARDKNAINTVMEHLLTAETPKDREQGLIDLLDAPVKAQLKKASEAPNPEKAQERKQSSEKDLSLPGRK